MSRFGPRSSIAMVPSVRPSLVARLDQGLDGRAPDLVRRGYRLHTLFVLVERDPVEDVAEKIPKVTTSLMVGFATSVNRLRRSRTR
jgi:hypothetical protein